MTTHSIWWLFAAFGGFWALTVFFTIALIRGGSGRRPR